MIWERSFVLRRVYPDISQKPSQIHHPGSESESSPEFATDPITLQVNQESRGVAMRFYQKRRHYQARNTSYINFELDTICIRLESLYSDQLPGFSYLSLIPCDDAHLNVTKADLAKVRYLNLKFTICDLCWARAVGRFHAWYNDWAPALSSLKEMKIVLAINSHSKTQKAIWQLFFSSLELKWKLAGPKIQVGELYVKELAGCTQRRVAPRGGQ